MKTYKNKKPLLAVALTLSLALGVASNVNQVMASGSTTQNLNVSASISAKCIINNPGTLAFGVYDPVGTNYSTPLDQTGSFAIQCTKGATGVIALDAGKNAANASTVSRAMKGSANSDYLSYELYTTAGHATVWNATNTVSYGPAANTSPYTQSVYGEIPAVTTVSANGLASPDSYSDQVVITVTY